VRAVRGFHSDQTRRQIGEERRHCGTTQRLSHDDFSVRVDAVNLKDVLRQV
jgi:hypothetical protein